MRTWIRSEAASLDLQSSRLSASTLAPNGSDCSTTVHHSDPLKVYSCPQNSPDHLFSFALQEERNHFSQSFYPGMNESDVCDDVTSSESTVASHANGITSKVTSTLISNGNSTNDSFVTKQTYRSPFTCASETSAVESSTVKEITSDVAAARRSSPPPPPPPPPPSLQLIDLCNRRSSPSDSLGESQSTNSSPFMTIASSFPPSTEHGFPEEFFTALRDLFSVLDDCKKGSVKVSDIEKRWVDDDSTVFSPKGLTDCLRKVSTSTGMVDFDRFCAAIKICLLKNQTLLVHSRGEEEGQDQEQKQETGERGGGGGCREDDEEDKDDYERHVTTHTVNQQVPSSPSEATFVRGGSVNSNCTSPTTAPYHYTRVNSSPQAVNRSHGAEVNTKIYANSSCMDHSSDLLHHHHLQQTRQAKLSSIDEQSLPPPLVFRETEQSDGHSVLSDNRDAMQHPSLGDSASLHHRYIKKPSNVHDQQHPHSPSVPGNQYYPPPSRRAFSNGHPNTRNHIISPCEVPLPLPNPVSLAAINKVTKLTTTTAPLLAKPPHAYSILRRIASETAASSTSSNNHTSSITNANTDAKTKGNHRHSVINYQVNGSSSSNDKNSPVPRNKERKFKATSLIQMFRRFNSVIEKRMHINISSKSNNAQGSLDTFDTKRPHQNIEGHDSSLVNSHCTNGKSSSDKSYLTANTSVHQQQMPLPPPPPSSHASSSVDFIETCPVPRLNATNSDSYIPHPPNVCHSYGIVAPASLDDAPEEDLPLHFQSSRTQMMRRKRDRRHTVSHGIDYNHIKKMQILQHEKDILLRGLQAVERAKDWYLKQMAEVTDKIRSAGQTFTPVPSDSCEAANERLQFRANRIIAANAHLIALMDEANFPIHMNLAFKPLLVPHSTDPIINLPVHPSLTGASSSSLARECTQVKKATIDCLTSEKNSHMSQMESEKSPPFHMFNGSTSGSRKGSTSDSPFV